MTSTRVLAKTTIILYAICFFTNADGKRSVSEMQIMHNLGEHLHSADRQNWLLERLQTVHHAPLVAEETVVDAKPREARSWRLHPEHFQAKIQRKPKDWNKGYRDSMFKTKPQ
uniref:Parathyroid hormone n=1 Tax=Anolis carolinensis TaxID=28377 RepID=H9GQQ7_ANOCA